MTEHDSTTPSPYAHIEMRNGKPVIDPLHPTILAAYRGSVIERTEHVRTLIQFPTLHHATSWANVNDSLHRVSLWLDSNDYTMDRPVIVRLHPDYRNGTV